MSETQKSPHVPNLKLDQLKQIADEKWSKLADGNIKKITLFRHKSRFEEQTDLFVTTKYVVVMESSLPCRKFNIDQITTCPSLMVDDYQAFGFFPTPFKSYQKDRCIFNYRYNELLPVGIRDLSTKDLEEAIKDYQILKKLNDVTEIMSTVIEAPPDKGKWPMYDLMDKYFPKDVYLKTPSEYWWREWRFIPIRREERLPEEQIQTDKCIVLYDKEVKKEIIKKEERLRPVQKHRLECRKVAKKLWAKDPKITIEEMTQQNEIIGACGGKKYTTKTIRKWINELCPDRSPGRRRKNCK